MNDKLQKALDEVPDSLINMVQEYPKHSKGILVRHIARESKHSIADVIDFLNTKGYKIDKI